MVELYARRGCQNFKIDLNDVKFSEFGGSVKNVKVDGTLINLIFYIITI